MRARIKKMENIGDVSEKKVSEILGLFMDLGVEDNKRDILFEQIKALYLTLNEYEKEALFVNIIKYIEISKDSLDPLLGQLAACDKDDPNFSELLLELRQRIVSPRLNIFRKIFHLPGGLKFLLDFRGDLLSIQRFSEGNFQPLDADIVLLLEIWFQEGFLYLEEITLDSAYRQIDLIKNNGLVHPMTSIEEMGQRLGKDRRCFALYHRLIPYEPVIFIEVALTRGIIKNITEIIGEGDIKTKKGDRDTAIFYSINNTQNGLTGLGMGKMLIGQVVDYLKKNQEQIKRFATLSPLPGFWKNYIKPILEGRDESFVLKQNDVPSFFSRKEIATIKSSAEINEDDNEQFCRTLLSFLSHETWIDNRVLRKALHQPLVKIAYFYITKEKNPRGKPLNPVANFHLGNGATISARNVNFLSNPSIRGLRESCGIMVNYIYSSTWLSQIRRSFRLFNRVEIKTIFSRH